MQSSVKLVFLEYTVYPKKYAHGFCFAVLCCGYTLTDFYISIRLTSLALWQSNDCPSASKATLMNMDKYFMWTHYERLHNHNKIKHNKTVCIFIGIYCKSLNHVPYRSFYKSRAYQVEIVIRPLVILFLIGYACAIPSHERPLDSLFRCLIRMTKYTGALCYWTFVRAIHWWMVVPLLKCL